ncbi:MAG TPA: RES domain-containing protein, partial [Actinomycetota bacterium]|nr:RES domain-containing protein [Actinomycetota bacterium]
MRFRHLSRGGPYVRVADPDWRLPLDGSYAAERGARWNPPGSFAVVYLGSTVAVARGNVLRRFAGLPYSVLDLLPERRPVLVETEVRAHRAVDVVTDAGARAAGLPTTYPRDDDGTEVRWDRCQPVGQAAWDQGETSIACRSTAAPLDQGEELAWFVRGRHDRLHV